MEKPASTGSIATLYILVVKLFAPWSKKGRNAGHTLKCFFAFKAEAEETKVYLFCVQIVMLVCTVQV